MKSTFFCFFILICFLHSLNADSSQEKPLSKGKTICLNMIVKNESKVIERCLASIKDQIDYWVIVDTGSVDGTQEIIKKYMKGIPGELHERPWVDFSCNRNEVLTLSKNKGDYILFMDADEKLIYSSSFVDLPVDLDYYYVPVRGSSSEFISYSRFLLVNNSFNWTWEDILHEYLEIPSNAKTFETLENVTCFTDSDGSRADDPKKWHKDAAVLEKALEKDSQNARHVFYLAQSYCNAKEYELAYKFYEKRASMTGGWESEVFWSLFASATIQEAFGKSEEAIMNAYCRAYLSDQTRAEPLYRLAKYYNIKGNGVLGCALSQLAVSLEEPKDSMYIQSWVYDYGALSSLYDSLVLLHKNKEAGIVLEKLLSKPNLPEDLRRKIQKNWLIILSEGLSEK